MLKIKGQKFEVDDLYFGIMVSHQQQFILFKSSIYVQKLWIFTKTNNMKGRTPVEHSRVVYFKPKNYFEPSSILV